MARRHWIGISALLGAGAVAASPAMRRQLRGAAEQVGPALRSATGDAGRVLAAPTDQMLAQARERLVPALPLPADAKWRTLQSLVRGLVAALPAEAQGATLRAAGRAMVNGGQAGPGVAESIRRATQSLGMAGELRREDGGLTVVTRSCALIADVADPSRTCELVCGTEGLLSGTAEPLDLRLESPLRMGDGADHCELRFWPPVEGTD